MWDVFVSVTTDIMLQRIANWFRRRKYVVLYEASLSRGDMRLELFRFTKPCGHPGCLLELFRDGADEPIRIAAVLGDDLPNAIDLFQDAAPLVFAEMGVRRLPTIPLWGKKFFIDERLRELRNVDDPADRVALKVA